MNAQKLTSIPRPTHPSAPSNPARWLMPLVLGLVSLYTTCSLRADINIPSDGSDGALIITTNTVIDLGRAVTGHWNDNNNAHAGDGIYDPEKWAVVFKYTNVTVAAGATLTFKNHPKRPPVVWLVQGDVTIDGTVSLDGGQPTTRFDNAEPGPGGSRGGSGYIPSGVAEAAGFGIGGGAVLPGIRFGAFGSDIRAYGNPSVLPLIGGSGAGGAPYRPVSTSDFPDGFGNAGGGAGGGAILIASKRTFAISGAVKANGGLGGYYFLSEYQPAFAACGSGGAIRIIATDCVGSGTLSAVTSAGRDSIAWGGPGRIRIERSRADVGLHSNPDPSVLELTDGDTPQIWLPDSGPTVKIVSVNNQQAPADPRAEFAAIGADLVLPQVSTSEVVVETTNVERESTVKVRVTPRSNGNFTLTQATLDQVVTEDPLVIRWKANVPVNNGYSALQVHVVRP